MSALFIFLSLLFCIWIFPHINTTVRGSHKWGEFATYCAPNKSILEPRTKWFICFFVWAIEKARSLMGPATGDALSYSCQKLKTCSWDVAGNCSLGSPKCVRWHWVLIGIPKSICGFLVRFDLVFVFDGCVVFIGDLQQWSVKHTLSLCLAKWCVALLCSVGTWMIVVQP